MKSNPGHSDYSLSFSHEAQMDVWDILQFTLEKWGSEQAEKYKSKLEKGFVTLLDNPKIGMKKDMFFAGCRCFHVERHMIFYMIKNKTIYIVRILRDDMDPLRHL